MQITLSTGNPDSSEGLLNEPSPRRRGKPRALPSMWSAFHLLLPF